MLRPEVATGVDVPPIAIAAALTSSVLDEIDISSVDEEVYSVDADEEDT